MTTQSEALNWLNAQVGQHLDYDHAAGQQCVDGFNYYYQFVTGRNPYNDGLHSPTIDGAKDLWNVRIGDFTYIPDSGNLEPQPGDIAIYGSGWGAGAGHVEMVVSSDAGGCTFVGENEHNNKYEGVVQVYRTFGQMRGLLGVMRPHWNVPAPAPALPPYTVEQITMKQVQTNKQPTHKWGMNYDNNTAMDNNPIATVDAGTILTVVGLVHHNNGQQYYKTSLDDPDGWNVNDCTDYTPPPPTPYVPPAAPLPVIKAEKYEVLTGLPYYGSSQDVATGKNSKGDIQPGNYYVWAKEGTNSNYWNLSTSNSKNEQLWINTISNKKPLNAPVDTTRLDPPEMDKPVDTPNPNPIPDSVDQSTMNWRGTLDLRYAGMYVFFNHNKEHDDSAASVQIFDLETGELKKTTANGTYAQFSGKVKWTDGNWYGRMKDSDGSFHWYAAHIEDLYPYNDVYGTRTTLQEREALHTLSTIDRLELGIAKIKTIGRDIWDVVKPKGKK